MSLSKKQELKNYVVNSIVHNAFDPNELLRLINLLPDQPQLNENQQIVLDYLKEITIEDVSPMRAMEFLKYELKPNEYGGFQASTVGEAFYKLNNKEEAQVLKVFSQWALEQEEE